jgi:hypothetical protein
MPFIDARSRKAQRGNEWASGFKSNEYSLLSIITLGLVIVFMNLSLDHLIRVTMDPLSITAGTIAFISAANTLLLLCYKLSTILEGPQEALKALIREVTDLRNIVENIQRLCWESTNIQRFASKGYLSYFLAFNISTIARMHNRTEESQQKGESAVEWPQPD